MILAPPVYLSSGRARTLSRKVISVAQNTVSPDGKTLTVAVTDTLHGTTSQFEAKKQ